MKSILRKIVAAILVMGFATCAWAADDKKKKPAPAAPEKPVKRPEKPEKPVKAPEKPVKDPVAPNEPPPPGRPNFPKRALGEWRPIAPVIPPKK